MESVFNYIAHPVCKHIAKAPQTNSNAEALSKSLQSHHTNGMTMQQNKINQGQTKTASCQQRLIRNAGFSSKNENMNIR